MQTENVHLLVVEDNPGYLSELLEWLREDYGYQQIKIRFEKIDGKDVCAIDVKKSLRKAWLQRTKEKKLEFYVRMSNKSEPLEIPDIYNHL